MGQSIYNIEREFLTLAEEITENGGEVTPEQEQALAINKESLEIKSVKYGYVIKSLEDDQASIDKEIKRLEALSKSKGNVIAKLKETVTTAMNLYGIDEIKLQNLKINFRASQSVEIEDESLVPSEYKKTKVTTTTSISKADITKAIKEGKEVPGAYLKDNKNIKFT